MSRSFVLVQVAAFAVTIAAIAGLAADLATAAFAADRTAHTIVLAKV